VRPSQRAFLLLPTLDVLMLFERGPDDSVRAVPQMKTSVSAPQRPALVLHVQAPRPRSSTAAATSCVPNQTPNRVRRNRLNRKKLDTGSENRQIRKTSCEDSHRRDHDSHRKKMVRTRGVSPGFPFPFGSGLKGLGQTATRPEKPAQT